MRSVTLSPSSADARSLCPPEITAAVRFLKKKKKKKNACEILRLGGHFVYKKDLLMCVKNLLECSLSLSLSLSLFASRDMKGRVAVGREGERMGRLRGANLMIPLTSPVKTTMTEDGVKESCREMKCVLGDT